MEIKRLGRLYVLNFLSRAFTVLNFEPSTATSADPNRPNWQHSATN